MVDGIQRHRIAILSRVLADREFIVGLIAQKPLAAHEVASQAATAWVTWLADQIQAEVDRRLGIVEGGT